MSTLALHSLEVAGIVQDTADTRSYLLAVPRALRSAYRYLAGQFLTFSVAPAGEELRRSYSLASAPETDPYLRITVKRVAGGRVSNWLHDRVAVGDRLLATAPEGRFVLKADAGERPLVLVGAGSGIAPLFGIMKSALAGTCRPVFLLTTNRRADLVIFRDEIEHWQGRHPGRLIVHHHLSGERGRLSLDETRSIIGACRDADVYLCGPAPFMDSVGAALDGLGVPAHRRFLERFFSPLDASRTPAAAPPSPAYAHPCFHLTIDGRTQEIAWRADQTVLDAAVAAGVPPPASCGDGFCGCCMAQLRQGAVYMPRRAALTDDDVNKGWILACQAKPAGAEPLWVDFDALY